MRRSFVAVALAVVAVGASTVQAKAITAAPPAQQAAAAAPAQAAPAADPLKFTADEVQVVISVKPGASADFEAGFAAMLAALGKSAKPELVAHGKTMTLQKIDVPFPADQPTLYVLAIHGASKDLSYNVGLILFYSGLPQGTVYSGILPTQEEALAIYNKVQGNITNMTVWPLKKVGG